MIARLIALIETLRPATRGALGVVVAMFFFSGMDSLAKDLSERLPAFQVVWARYTGQTVLLMILVAPSLRQVMRTASPLVQGLRSLFLFGATMFFFSSLAFLPLAEAVSLLQLAPLLITALAALVLSEPVGPRRWIGVGAGLCGALIMLKPGLGVFQPAALLAVAAAFCLASYQIATRMLGAVDPIRTTMLYTTLFGTLAASLALPFVWVTPAVTDLPQLLAIGAVGFVGQLALVWGLGQAPASLLAPYNYTGIVWAVILGFVFFHEVPEPSTLLGIAVIVGAGLYVWHRERVKTARS